MVVNENEKQFVSIGYTFLCYFDSLNPRFNLNFTNLNICFLCRKLRCIQCRHGKAKCPIFHGLHLTSIDLTILTFKTLQQVLQLSNIVENSGVLFRNQFLEFDLFFGEHNGQGWIDLRWKQCIFLVLLKWSEKWDWKESFDADWWKRISYN